MGRYLDILAAADGGGQGKGDRRAASNRRPAGHDKNDISHVEAPNDAEILVFSRESGHDQSPPATTTKAVAPVADTFVYLDFETRNTGGIDLETAGARRYAVDPATEIICLTYQRVGGEPQLWRPGNGCDEPLLALARDVDVRFLCFGEFEIAVWDSILAWRYGFPVIDRKRRHDARAACSYFALPRSLAKVLPVIGAPVTKDAEGRRLVLSLSRPNCRNGSYPELTPGVLDRVAAYNMLDVAGLAAVHAATGDLPERERRIWELDQKINQRGVCIDVELVKAAKRIAETAAGTLRGEFAELTGGLSPYRIEGIRDWLKGRGFPLADLQQATVEDALEQLRLPEDVKRVLEIRQILAPTSLTKLDAMLACVGADGRARGLFQYHAATPGRWSAQLLQPQNLPRPTIDIAVDGIEELVEAIKAASNLERWCEPAEPGGKRKSPIEVLASALRFALKAGDGMEFGCGDFAMIEACVLLALAGQRDRCAEIGAGIDIHRDMAAQIFGLDRDTFLAIPKDELTLEQQEQRRIGKNTIHGCGYQMGAETFQRRYLRHLGAEEAKRIAERVINAYRRVWAPGVPRLWHDLEHAARRAMLVPGVPARAGCGISYRLEKIAGRPRLACELLNGKCIYYQDARISPDRVDRFGNPTWTYWAYRKGQWREIEPYGGQLTENAVQALARELLVEAMLRFHERGHPVVMHCHDEIVVERAGVTAAKVEEIMSERPEWAVKLGVPIAVEAWVGKRYRK
jgi:DNA polymerase